MPSEGTTIGLNGLTLSCHAPPPGRINYIRITMDPRPRHGEVMPDAALVTVEVAINKRKFGQERLLPLSDVETLLDQLLDDAARSLREAIAGELCARINETPFREGAQP